MPDFGFIRIALCPGKLALACPEKNAVAAVKLVRQAFKAGSQLAVFPELFLTGYSCGDLFAQPALLSETQKALETFLKKTATFELPIIIGAPLLIEGRLYDCAVVVKLGKILGVVPNTLPQEKYFAPGSSEKANLVFKSGECAFTIGFASEFFDWRENISRRAALGETLIVLGALPELAGTEEKLKSAMSSRSAIWQGAIAFVSTGEGESSTDFAFGGRAAVFENGKLLANLGPFSEEEILTAEIDAEFLRRERAARVPEAASVVEISLPPIKEPKRVFSPRPFVPEDAEELKKRTELIFAIQCAGLKSRLLASKAKRVLIGVSGGLDSTLALLVASETVKKLGWPASSVIGVTMPCFGTTTRTKSNAQKLLKLLGAEAREINIEKAVRQHFLDIEEPSDARDAAFENAQARERTQVLMDLGNRLGGLVVGTGDLSESALGWATYNGDHISMYNVNAGLSKTLIRALVGNIAEKREKLAPVLKDILATPISPELLPGSQPTEDLVGPYELHDFFLYHFLRRGAKPEKILFLAEKTFAGRFTKAVIKKWLQVFLKRFLSQQFKRSCSPDGPATGSVSLSPRAGLKLPSDAAFEPWKELLD